MLIVQILSIDSPYLMLVSPDPVVDQSEPLIGLALTDYQIYSLRPTMPMPYGQSRCSMPPLSIRSRRGRRLCSRRLQPIVQTVCRTRAVVRLTCSHVMFNLDQKFAKCGRLLVEAEYSETLL